MSFRTHVFISYAHNDNDSTTGAWVSRFHELLEGYLRSTLKRTKPVIWRDKRLSDNEVFDASIMQNLADSAVMVAVLTDNYVASEWCQREAHAFCEQAEKSTGVAAENLLRVFKVIKRPPETEQTLPPPMRTITGKPFYVRIGKDERESNDELDKPVELDPGMGDAFAAKLRLRVNMLAQDIANTLRAIAAVAPTGAGPAAAAPAPQRPTVYLAQCGDDRADDRMALRSELMQRGYTVLPDRELPMVETVYREEVARLLERCVMSIHLLGAKSGPVPDGDGEESVVAIQNALAVERGKGAAFRRVVSLPAGTVATKASHQRFLEDMHTRAEMQGGCELITGDLEAVKSAMHTALKIIETPPPPPSVPATERGRTVYVIFDKPDFAASKPLRIALEEAGLTVLKPLFEGEPEALREANFARLIACDAVLVFYGSGTDQWKDAVDSDVLRARALRANRPALAAFTWLAGASTAEKEDLAGRKNVIDGRAGFSPSLVEPILQAMGAPAHG
jgi:TIR domain